MGLRGVATSDAMSRDARSWKHEQPECRRRDDANRSGCRGQKVDMTTNALLHLKYHRSKSYEANTNTTVEGR